MRAVDLFAGPGGWDVGARELDIDPLGIEWDDAACRVREAAGLRTLQADVAALDPLDFPCDLLIASPPCTAFSMAGKGEGRKAIDALLACVHRMGDGEVIDQAELDEACSDETAHLVLEPLRWALALRPGMVCCEQVPPVLPLWEAMADVLHRLHRYHVWTGLLSAERYATPQTRKRAFLIASLDGPVGAPTPTHQRYVAPRSRDDEGGGLFDLPDAERIVAPGDGHLLPWVSMAEALGWGMTARPSVTVVSRSSSQGSPDPLDGGSGARRLLREAQEAGRWVMRANAATNATVRDVDEPAPTITGGHDHGDRVWKYDPRQTGAAPRPVEEPAPTMTVEWAYGVSVAGKRPRTRPITEPAPSITGAGAGGLDEWVGKRPATTVAGDPRISHPGGHTANDGRDNSRMVGRTEGAVRVTIEQAACLQGFPDNYPWQAAGSRSAAFRCIGNAVPPPLARAVLAEALSSVNEAAA